MTLLVALAVLSVAAIGWSLVAVVTDRPAAPAPRSHAVDPDFVAPAARQHLPHAA